MNYRICLFLVTCSLSLHAMDEVTTWITGIQDEVAIETQRAFYPDTIASLIRKKLNTYLLQSIKEANLQHLQTLLHTYPTIIRNKPWFEISLQELLNPHDSDHKKVLLTIATELLTRHLRDAHDNNYTISYCPLLLACQYDLPELVEHCLTAGFDPRTKPINQQSSVSWALAQYKTGNMCAHLILQQYETLEPSFSLAQLQRYDQLKQRAWVAIPVVITCAIAAILYLAWQRMHTTKDDGEDEREEQESVPTQADPITKGSNP